MPRIHLLVLDHDTPEGSGAVARFGGTPMVPPGFAWPACRVCRGNMQFLCTIAEEAPPRRHLVFMCQNRPGLCEEWDPDYGGNAVVRCDAAQLRPADLPAQGEVLAAARHAARVVAVEAADYWAARDAWAEANSGRVLDVLGQIGGEPAWQQADETPACNDCGQPMRFVAQIEEGPDHRTALNFGSGAAYLFACDCAGGRGKFLWQC